MKENKKDNSEDSGDSTGEGEEYTYQSAGIRERDGTIPLWLILVGVGLMIWSGYYLFRYWTPVG
ncbi:MAG: hypothetical protein NPINA01_23180 [Nitrospinaceae bacterium]|nr:MAG: hypothetical protein NPINA01_23180 [Nitrospinaceae bacterium]